MNDTQLDTFETALLTELRREVAEHPALVAAPPPARPRRPRRRLAALGASGVAASVAVVLGVGLGGGGSPAFAVDEDGHGDVIVTIHRLDDAAGLEEALKAQGIDADVSYDPDANTSAAMLGSNGPGPAVPAPGSGPSEGGLTQQQEKGGGPVTTGPGPEAGGKDPCGAIDPAPARLTHGADDWVLTIPAGSPLQNRHVVIGTGPDGSLSVQYAGDEPGTFCGLMSMNAPGLGTK